MKPDFRQVAGSEVDEAYAVYLEVFEWLNAKGVRQWLEAHPRKKFVDRQRNGQLFAHYIEGRIAAVVTVAFDTNPYWSDEIARDRRWWVWTLAVARRYSGARVGEHVMQECETLIRGAGAAEAFLDCVTGFLPGYYRRLGYEELGRKDMTFPSGNTLPMVLMRKKLARS